MLARLGTLLHRFNFTHLTAMSVVNNTNVACCTVPPVSSDYTPKGTIKPYGGFQKVYVTGTEKPSAITLVCIYDIFGIQPQTQQGADILAETLDAHVIMPDFFEPDGSWPLDQFPPSSAEQGAKLQAFFGGAASPKDNTVKLFKLGAQLKADGAGYLVGYGFCWGGKVATLVGTQPSTPFDAIANIHPAMVSAEDAEKLKVPYAFYWTKDEPEDESLKVVDILTKNTWATKNDYKLYDRPAFHGFAAARADLTNEGIRKEFEDVYSRLASWITQAKAA